MCGISGYIGNGCLDDLEAMASRLVHRGPDDANFWQSRPDDIPAGFAFRRLVVIDPEGGQQPMLSEGRDTVVVFNGEIYNHAELRRQLVSKGYHFKSDHSDTEVLVHGYREWGEDLVARLNGMFAFAIWDNVRKRLIAATDPFGKKPFYFARLRGGLAFASELLALACHRSVSPDIDRDALARYFAFGFMPEDTTPFSAVEKLGAGQLLRYDGERDELVIRHYWEYRIQQAPPEGSWHDWKTNLRALLEQAVSRRLEADVSLGFLLSGGLDSALLLALARQQRPDVALPCFTIGFEEPSYDESAAARITAGSLNATHHVETLSLKRMCELTNEVLGRMDEPLADPSLLPTALLCRFARKDVTVAISGDGADELFAGYDTFAALPMAEKYHTIIPKTVHRALVRLADLLPRRESNLSFDFKLRRALRGLSHPEALWHAAWLAPASVDEISRIFAQSFGADDLYRSVLLHHAGSQASYRRDRALEYYTKFYLQSNILPKIDRGSMMYSLELRSPFLDRDVASFCASLPYNAKHGKGIRKRLLRAVASELLPREILQRRKKGFGIPISTWLRAMDRPALEPMRDLGLDTAILDNAWSEHRRGLRDHRGLLWAWLCLDRWLISVGELKAQRSRMA
jgi:asparagine synthase (glutamine-hydrolysing)